MAGLARFLVICMLLRSISGRTSWQVPVFTPTYFRPGSDFLVTVDMHDYINIAGGVYDVSADFQTSPGYTTRVSANATLTTDKSRTNINLQIPESVNGDYYGHRIYLQIFKADNRYRVGYSYIYISRKQDNIQDTILIQTDKGLYKAGQTVNLRVMMINHLRQIQNTNITINIHDGDGNRVRRWENATDPSGVIVKQMEMSEYPVLGTWTIQANSRNTSVTQAFDVEAFVLPKFDVTLELPEIVSRRDSYIIGDAKVMYTFGKGVAGTLELILSFGKNSFSKIYQLDDGQVKLNLPITDVEEVLQPLNSKQTHSIVWGPYASEHGMATHVFRGTPNSSFALRAPSLSSSKIVRHGSTADWWSSVPRDRWWSSTTTSRPNNQHKQTVVTVMVKAIATEDLTGLTRNYTGKITIVTYNAMLKIDGGAGTRYFKPNETFEIKGFVASYSGSVYDGLAGEDYQVTSQLKYLLRSGRYLSDEQKELILDDKNSFVLQCDTSAYDKNTMYHIYLQINLTNRATGYVVSSTWNYLYLSSGAKGNYISIIQLTKGKYFNVGDNIRYKVSLIGESVVTATYRVVSQNVVFAAGVGPWFTLSEKSPYEIEVNATEEMVPSFTVAAWFTFPDNSYQTLEAASIRTVVQPPSQEEELSVSYNNNPMQPGNDAELSFHAVPNSDIYVLAIDKSVLLLSKGNDITEQRLPSVSDSMNNFPSLDSYNILYHAGIMFTRVYVYMYTEYAETTTQWILNTIYEDFITSTQALALAPSTQMEMQSAVSTRIPKVGLPTKSATPKTAEKQETVRKLFPDTWLFFSIKADSMGRASSVNKVPNTITTWVTSCFAVTPQSKLMVAKRTAEVIVTLKKSKQFRNLAIVKRRKRLIVKEKTGSAVKCILAKAGRATPAYFPILPTEVGSVKITMTADSSVNKDTVIKYLRVEAEGAPKDTAHQIMVDLRPTTTFDTKIDIAYPSNTVEGSQRMRLSVFGEVLGPTIDGLQRLIQAPYGCGEQNIISTAPSVFVYKYLQTVGKLTTQLQETMENYMRIGIQRELTYRHPDWSFSAWGGTGSGSTWLTAFVLKVFSMATHFVDVDDIVIANPLKWLISIQQQDGSFREVGRVNSRSMQGGSADNGERMTAYVLIAMIEAKRSTVEMDFKAGLNLIYKYCTTTECHGKLSNAISKAAEYLAVHSMNMTTAYSLAISTYALGQSGHEKSRVVLELLRDYAKESGASLYFEEKTQPVYNSFYYGAPVKAVTIEMTAYALMAFMIKNETASALKIQKWLIEQRNPYGGFVSTQDTVIALQALSEISSKITIQPDMTIVVSYTDTRLRKKTFRITPENTMIMQFADLSTNTKAVSVHAWGKQGSVAIVTISLFYNGVTDLENSILGLKVDILKETINMFTLRSCVNWRSNETSGMIVVEIGIPSGFVVDSLEIPPQPLLMRTEIEDSKFVLYYDEVTFKDICTVIPMVRDKMVANMKPVPCKAYEYYEPSNEVMVFYAPVTAKKSNICNVCGLECGCTLEKVQSWFPKPWCKRQINRVR